MPASVLVPLVQRPEGLKVLLTRRTEHLRDHAGQISFPGGRAEPHDADAAATALREAEEEVGLSRGAVDVIGRAAALHHRDALSSSRRWSRWCSRRSTLQLDGFEVAEAFEVPLAFLMTPAHHQRHELRAAGPAPAVPVDALAGPATSRARRAPTSSGAPLRRCCATCTASCAT